MLDELHKMHAADPYLPMFVVILGGFIVFSLVALIVTVCNSLKKK